VSRGCDRTRLEAALEPAYQSEETRSNLARWLARQPDDVRLNIALALRNGTPMSEGEPDTDAERRLYPIVTDLEAESLPAPEWGMEGLYPHGGLVVLFAPRGKGKTFASLGFSFSHASGLPCLDRRPHQGSVVYIMGEGRGGLGNRVRAQKAFLGLEGDVGVRFVTTAVPMLDDGEVGRLIATIQSLHEPVAAVVWDTLSRTFIGGDENSSKDMALYVAAVDRVKDAVGGTAIVQHHTGHGSVERERGSSVLGGAADTIMALRDRDGLLTLECDKQKDAVEFSPIALQLHPVGDSCVLKVHDTPWNKGDFLSHVEAQALRTLHDSFLADGGSASAWLAASEMPTSSFYKARTSLVRRHLADQRGEGRGARYVITEDGARLLKVHSSTVTP
jgi:hypothetical protein